MIINNSDLFCSFILIEKNAYECMKCGIRLVTKDGEESPPLLPCSSPITNYSAAAVKNFIGEHINNEELCTEEEIEKRHDICSTCEFFSNSSCTKCGCSLSRDKIYMNKLAIKNQSCPVNKW